MLHYVVHLSLECLQHQWHLGDTNVTPESVMLGEGIQLDLVLSMQPWALRMPPTFVD
jgi:hypothetical protein